MNNISWCEQDVCSRGNREARETGYLDDGRSKLLALVEDALVVIEGDIEQDSRLVFWWPAGQRRVLFQTSGNWAWEYRRQCKYAEGYSYCDADTGMFVWLLRLFDKTILLVYRLQMK